MSLDSKRTILIADDEANMRKVLAAMLRSEGYEVHTVADGQEALDLLGRLHVDVLLTDLRMPRVDGMELLRRVLASHDDVPVVMLTAHGTVDTAVSAMKLGAFDYLSKPFDKDELRLVIRKAAATAALNIEEPEKGQSGLGKYGMIGQSPKLQAVFKTIEKVAASPTTVLITGESGTGKELIAAALHNNSPRADKPFIKINCAAIPRDLLESELFGYEKGAFTGAVSSKPGRFELADTGTLFLDEIGTIPLEMQVKLLRALQESEFERVGGVTTTRVNVRLIAATNSDLAAEAAAGRFREDLYYRLNVVPLVLPPLRERIEDIPPLTEHFRHKYNERLGKKLERITEGALACLQRYQWPGNIRELENVMERAVLFAEGAVITPDDLPDIIRAPDARPAEATPTPHVIGPLKEIVRQHTENLEKALIMRALEETGGNVTKAARKLEISRKSLQNKMKELGLRGQPTEEGDANDSTPPEQA
ncbi:sigma-54 dependent transcriptional regulator [Myxococcota bacterium]|nr:sigma-54 dependent transcriptional regulator [Myxococcota bacterium]